MAIIGDKKYNTLPLVYRPTVSSGAGVTNQLSTILQQIYLTAQHQGRTVLTQTYAFGSYDWSDGLLSGQLTAGVFPEYAKNICVARGRNAIPAGATGLQANISFCASWLLGQVTATYMIACSDGTNTDTATLEKSITLKRGPDDRLYNGMQHFLWQDPIVDSAKLSFVNITPTTGTVYEIRVFLKLEEASGFQVQFIPTYCNVLWEISY